MYSMTFGRAININEEIDEILSRTAWQRLATLKKASQLGLTVTPEQTIAMIQRQPIFRSQQTGQFDKNLYNAFANNFLPRTGMSAKAFEQMFAENVLIEKASATATKNALVTEDEIKKAFHLYTDMVTVDYASVPRGLAEIPSLTDADANAYFEANKDQFRMPEKAIVDYVQFAVADYTNSVTVSKELIARFYEGNKQRYVKPVAADAPEGAAPEYTPLEEVKGAITAELTTVLARNAAADKADALVASLADETTTFQQVADQAGLKIVNNTPAFTLTDSVRGVDPTAPFARAAFALETEGTHYYSDPVVGRDFVYVISLTKKLPSFLPSFDVVKAEAMESAKIAAAEKAYVEKAGAIQTELAAAVKAGTAFADAASKYKLALKTTVPFNATSTLEDEFGRQIMGAALSLDAGTVAELIPTQGDFLIAYVSKKELGDEATALAGMREELVSSIENEKSARLAAAWQESLLVEANFEDLRGNAATNGES
jgi:peptidyl-prolyl cis-trans isomerase D